MSKTLHLRLSEKSGNKDEWLTPPWVIEALGKFDLDPCAPSDDRRPWDTATEHYSLPSDDGLLLPWGGGGTTRVWMNPPYGTQTSRWLERLAMHGNGIALVFARTETRMFFEYVWESAHAVLFFQGRLAFYHVDGTEADHNGGAPSVLVAYGEKNAEALEKAARSGTIKGKFIRLKGNG